MGLRLAGSLPVLADAGPVRLRLTIAEGSAPKTGSVALFDAQGRRRRMLWSGVLTPGLPRSLVWDGNDDDGNPVGSGLYWARFAGSGQDKVLRLVYVR